MHTGIGQLRPEALPYGGIQPYLVVSADIINRVVRRQRPAKRQRHRKVLIIAAYHIAGHHNDIRLFTADHPQQTDIILAEGNAVQVGKLQDAIALKAFRELFSAGCIAYRFQSAVTIP